MTNVLSMLGEPVTAPIEINVEESLESTDVILQILWAACKVNPAKFKHLRMHREDGSFDTTKSVLARIERHVKFLQDAINRSR